MDQSQPKLESINENRRTQARIDLHIPVKVVLPGHDEPVTATNQDISWGGALLLIAEPLPQQTGPLRISLPWKRGEEITVHAQLLRAKPLQDGQYLAAVRFVSLSPRSQSRLERLLKMLSTSQESTELDAPSDLFRELEVTVSDADELRRVLRQVATGKYKVTVFDAYELNQSISLSITGTQDLPGIRLRARVMDVRRSRSKGFDWTNLYTLSLEFEHPRRSVKAFVKLLLDQLPEACPERRGVPDWMRRATLARSARDRAVHSGALCALETQFPEAINRLVAGWGDADAFDIMFCDLMFGEQGQPGGWPAAAWAELELLQNIHDTAYGVPSTRGQVLRGGRVA